MKLLYASVLLIMEALIIFAISRTLITSHKTSPLAKKTRRLLSAAFLTVLPNILNVCIFSDAAAYYFFTWYFCFIDILLFALIYFSAEYAFPNSIASRDFVTSVYIFFTRDLKYFKHKKMQKTNLFEREMILLSVAVLADVVFLVQNIVTHNIFTVERIFYDSYFFTPDIYFRISSNWLYDIHLSFCYLLITLSLLCMIFKMAKSVNLYKIKYISVILQIIFIVFLNAFYIVFNLPVDFSVTFYGLISVSLYFFAFNYIPRHLQKAALTRVIRNMNTGIMILDNDDQCIYMNDYIREIYHIKNDQNPNTVMAPIIKRISKGAPLSEHEPFEETTHRSEQGKESYYKLSFSRIENRSKKFLGSYFLLIDTTEENNREKIEHYKNTHDELTGLYSKNYFYDQVALTIEANPNEKYFIVCCDIGKFKLVNELYGVSVGDKILKSIAREFKERTVIGEVFGRIDNDRFAILIPKDRLNLQIFIDAAQEIFKNTLNLAISPTAYFGVYEVEDPDMYISFMCDRAFIAIDTIKGQYGKQVAWYDSKLRDNVLREQELVYQLPEAISTGRIKIYLQPQANYEGRAFGAEALVRWEHPNEGIVSPSEFISIFEKNGMITKLDRFVWRLAFQKLFEWKNAGKENIYISVNISPKDFYLMNILQEFTALLDEFDINPKNIHLEFTEDVMMMDLDRQIKLIEALHKKGFTIEIGDFGAGYTSLKILRECDIDILKIDIDFLFNTHIPRNAHIIMKQLITMAENLGVKVLAKGIETKDQLDLLHDDGCELFQGFYFSKPLDTLSFEKIYL